MFGIITPSIKYMCRVAAVAQSIRLNLPSCRPVFESQAHQLCIYRSEFELWHDEKAKINRKRVRALAHLKKVQASISLQLNRTILLQKIYGSFLYGTNDDDGFALKYDLSSWNETKRAKNSFFFFFFFHSAVFCFTYPFVRPSSQSGKFQNFSFK